MVLCELFRCPSGVWAVYRTGIAATVLAVILAAFAVVAPRNVIAFDVASGNLIANGDFSTSASAFRVSPGYIHTGSISASADQNPPAPTRLAFDSGQNTIGGRGQMRRNP